MIDLHAAAARVSGILAHVADDALPAPTPCPGTSVGDLIDHIGGLAGAFTAAARKDLGAAGASGPPPKPDAAHLGARWRERLRASLDGLADAWSDPAAWQGSTTVGGVDLPAGVAGLVALDELVVHGWDVAVATGQPYAVPPEEVEAAMAFVATVDAPRDGSLFGPVVEVAGDAPPLDQLLGLTGRDPAWVPPSA